MPNKTLISLAVASSIALTGCLDDGSSSKNANPDYKIGSESYGVSPIFDAIGGNLPIPNDLIFDSETGDGTFGVDDTQPPVTTALNNLSGASTVAPAVIAFDGQIDPDSVDGTPYTDEGTPNPNQNVFLIELEYASGDPVRALSISEPPTISQTPLYEAEVVTLDGNSAIRINPLQPLNPGKRYVVAITDSIRDIYGDPITPHPTYANVTLDGENAPLMNPQLAPVRQLVNSLWEPIATQYFGATGTNPGNIVLSYSFTTSADEKVLPYIANPMAWLQDQLGTAAKLEQIQGMVQAAQRAQSGEDVDPALYDFNGDGAFNYDDTSKAAAGVEAQAAEDLPTLIAANIETINRIPFPSPARLKDQVVVSEEFDTQDALELSAALSPIVGAPDLVAVSQGSISLPYYLGTSPEGIMTESWSADNELAATLMTTAEALGYSLQIPQADETRSDVVNHYFPFPETTSDSFESMPLLVIHPDEEPGTDLSQLPVIIYQHGITTDRSTALAFGSALVKNFPSVVVAIDQPLHGVVPTGSTIPGLEMTENERHFGLTANASQRPTALTADDAAEGSGGLFINLNSFLTTRDNLRQGAVDLMHLRANLKKIDPLAAGTGLNTKNVFFIGHSLGTINGAPFVSAVNEGASSTEELSIKAANLLTPGAGIVRMLENSDEFAPRILGGLAAAAGLQQGDAGLETYLNVFQAALDSVDPINFADNLNESGTPLLLSEVVGDEVIPNDPYAKPLGNAFSAPLSGTEPLADELGTNASITRYEDESATHSTPIAPQSGPEVAVFQQMVAEAATLFGTILATGSGGAEESTQPE